MKIIESKLGAQVTDIHGIGTGGIEIKIGDHYLQQKKMVSSKAQPISSIKMVK